MAQVELIMPKMGESVAEATIIKWLKNEGDKVSEDESIVEIATDKVDSEVPSHVDGILIKCLCKEGDVVKVGEPFAIISSDSTLVVDKPLIVEEQIAESPTIKDELAVDTTMPKLAVIKLEKSSSDNFYSPLVRKIAEKEGITINDLESIVGTGVDGRVTKNDVLSYIPLKNKGSINTSSKENKKPSISFGAEDEIVEMDRMRKMISEHMLMSKQTSAHVTSFVEADMTNIVNWRNKVKKDFENKEGEKLTYTPIIIEVLAKVIREFPQVNVSVDETKIIYRKNINIGMATALPSGNLIVPVIKNADTLSLLGITKKVNSLAHNARNGKLSPEDIQNGTYTLSNVGSFGNTMGTPIINQPQVAILAIGVIKKKPAVIETPYGDTIGIRYFMHLSHTFDHRVIDGSVGGRFVKRVADLLEQWDVNQ